MLLNWVIILVCKVNKTILMMFQRPDAVDLIELPLRVQVMVAQSNANMWRRNGFALVNQVNIIHLYIVWEHWPDTHE